ncbi:MAG: RHS repeat-associated core domain-containing protein [Acidobacteriota bacterium]
MAELLAWEDRGLKATSARLDLGGATQRYTYDGAGRLTRAEWIDGGESLPSTPEAWSYTYDSVENLKQRQIEGSLTLCGSPNTEMLDDGSGRHRPSQVGDTVLEWNKRGSLVRKGDQRFRYDAENRLIEVRNATADSLVARYAYDVEGRRILREVNGTTLATVWDGWQAIEEHDVTDAQSPFLTSRRVFGVGLDEIAQLEQRLGATMEAYYPIYDSIGNVVAIADDSGALVERYLYDPHGKRSIWLDNEPPEIHQIRVEDGTIVLEATEALRAIDASQITLSRPSDSMIFPVTVTQPVTTGRIAHRRVEIELSGAQPAAGDTLQLTIAGADLVDLWGHEAAAGLDESWTWQSATDAVLADTQAPKIEEAVAEDGTLRVVFSEPVDTTQLATALSVDGAVATWTVTPDGYGVETALADGEHTLTASLSDSFDLNGRPLDHASPTIGTFTIASAGCDVLHAEPESDLLVGSTVGNVHGFHGRPHDDETGFVYIRNRYYDPAMGRFITADPLGYVDGPSVYAFAMNSPVNYGDPLGLQCMGIFGGENNLCTDIFQYWEPGVFHRERVDLIAQSRDLSLTQEERNRAALKSNAQIPLFFSESGIRFLWNSIVHGWAVEWDESIAVEKRHAELIAAFDGPLGMAYLGTIRQLEEEGYDTRYLIKGGMPGPPAGRMAKGLGKELRLASRVKDSSFAVRQAQRMSQAAQRDVDNLLMALRRGNVNPGVGSRPLGRGFIELRGRNAGRVIVRRTGEDSFDIVGKFQAHVRGDDANSAIITRLIDDYLE